MSTVWRFTGNPENWITAFSIGKWALNEHNRPLWERDIQSGDTILFHATRKSDFTDDSVSSIVGFGYVGEPLTKKKDFWWVQEVRDRQNYWPYVVPLKEVYLFSDPVGIDLTTPVHRKPAGQVKEEIRRLIAAGIAIRDLNSKALHLNPHCPQFPVNGSASRVNHLYEKLILERTQELYFPDEMQDTEVLEEKLAEEIDEGLSCLDKQALLEAAQAFDNSGEESHSVKSGPRKVRKENQVQKRRIAALEEFTCQLCGFKCDYVTKNGKKAWVIHVDHIVEKQQKGSENIHNLWVLCPNCHAKLAKRGAILPTIRKRLRAPRMLFPRLTTPPSEKVQPDGRYGFG